MQVIWLQKMCLLSRTVVQVIALKKMCILSRTIVQVTALQNCTLFVPSIVVSTVDKRLRKRDGWKPLLLTLGYWSLWSPASVACRGTVSGQVVLHYRLLAAIEPAPPAQWSVKLHVPWSRQQWIFFFFSFSCTVDNCKCLPLIAARVLTITVKRISSEESQKDIKRREPKGYQGYQAKRAKRISRILSEESQKDIMRRETKGYQAKRVQKFV